MQRSPPANYLAANIYMWGVKRLRKTSPPSPPFECFLEPWCPSRIRRSCSSRGCSIPVRNSLPGYRVGMLSMVSEWRAEARSVRAPSLIVRSGLMTSEGYGIGHINGAIASWRYEFREFNHTTATVETPGPSFPIGPLLELSQTFSLCWLF